jgi:hypothetical protein
VTLTYRLGIVLHYWFKYEIFIFWPFTF